MQPFGLAIFYLVLLASIAAWGLAIQRMSRREPVFDPVPGPRSPISIFAFVSVVWLMTALSVGAWLLPGEAEAPIEPSVPAPLDTETVDVIDAEEAVQGSAELADEQVDAAEAGEPEETELELLVKGLLFELVIFAFLVLILWQSSEPLPQPVAEPDAAVPQPPSTRRFQPLKEFQQGALAFLLSLPLVIGVNVTVRSLVQDDSLHPLLETVQQDQSLPLVLLVALNAIVMAPLMEELQFRVILQGWLADRVPSRLAVAIPAVVFCGVHRFPDAFALVPLAIALGWLYHQRGSYLAVVTAHSLFNLFFLTLTVIGS